MANASSHFRRSLDSKSDYERVLVPAFMGYHDAASSKGFCKAYEKMSETQQRNYENGRLVATNILSAGLKLPAWNRPDVVSTRLVSVKKNAMRLVGAATKLNRQPASAEDKYEGKEQHA